MALATQVRAEAVGTHCVAGSPRSRGRRGLVVSGHTEEPKVLGRETRNQVGKWVVHMTLWISGAGSGAPCSPSAAHGAGPTAGDPVLLEQQRSISPPFFFLRCIYLFERERERNNLQQTPRLSLEPRGGARTLDPEIMT